VLLLVWRSVLHHSQVVPALGGSISGEHLFIALPYYANGSLEEYMAKSPELPIVQIVSMALDIAMGYERRSCVVLRECAVMWVAGNIHDL
jgi:serine/threonine protein kinase